jgi:hypothetical protein
MYNRWMSRSFQQTVARVLDFTNTALLKPLREQPVAFPDLNMWKFVVPLLALGNSVSAQFGAPSVSPTLPLNPPAPTL